MKKEETDIKNIFWFGADGTKKFVDKVLEEIYNRRNKNKV